MCQHRKLSGIVEHTYSPRGKAFEWQNDYYYDYNYDPQTMNMTPFRTGLEIETDIVGNMTNIFFLANRNSGLVATLATTFPYD